MGKIFYIMGKSSSGKDTIFQEIFRRQTWNLKKIILYTTRPARADEKDGEDYYFVNEETLKKMEAMGRVIELRAYETVHGIWKYFTADSGQIDLENDCYLSIGTLESYRKIREYFGSEKVVPLYIEVEDGERLLRALKREKNQTQPRYEELCRRFLADSRDFSEKNLEAAGITKRFQNNTTLNQCADEILEYIGKILKEK